MKKKKVVKKKINKFKLLGAIVFLIILLRYITNIVVPEKTNDEITFLLDNEVISTKNELFIDENNVIYLSKEDVENIFDNTIYYNDAEKELITTFNKHIAVLKVEENFMVVNDSNIELKSPVIEKNKKIYLPISEMGIIYDLEFEYSEETKKIMADSLSKEKKRALILKKNKLSKKAFGFSRKIEELRQGEYVVIIKEQGRYVKIRTAKGNIGYIKSNKISKPEIVRENWIEVKTDVNILKQASDLSKNYREVILEKEKTNVVIPEFFYIDTNNTLLDKTSSSTEEYTDYINWTKENNIEVWPTLLNNIEVSNSLRTYTDRNKIINSIYYALVNYQFSGININFKKIDDINSFNRFIIELTPRLKELGIKVAVTVNNNVKQEKLKNIVDIIIE